ncbi:MAG TPA: hypothetical protein VEO95_04405 [Chthoniobacteraceae bacterium]|nr:hypothetical protein [Chthoniobacteraceae bacterium]
MRSLIAIVALVIFTVAADAVVANLAPEFTFLGPSEKAQSLRSLRGQAVVLVIADSAKNKALRQQLKNLEGIYQALASKQVVLVAAIGSGEGPVPSNIPVALANNGAAVAAAYGVSKGFQIAIIGRDGNLDCQAGHVLPADRVRDVIQNSFEIQNSARKIPGGESKQ